MKQFLFLLLLLAGSCKAFAQYGLLFNKRNVDCEDHWVAYKPDKDSSYQYGFIYIDEEAGLTFFLEGTFKVNDAGRFVPEKMKDASIRAHLQPNNVPLAFIPPSRFGELKIAAVPDWLHFYKTDTGSVQRLYRWGYLYNSWENCGKAVDYLQRAFRLDKNHEGVGGELAYTYNCLQGYDSAIAVAKSALKGRPSDAYVHKELIFALLKKDRLEAAAEQCNRALAVCRDTSFNAENCYNVLQHYYEKKDKANFAHWLTETKKWMQDGSLIARNVGAMEERMQ